MNKSRYTYRMRQILLAIVFWEIVFWSLFFLISSLLEKGGSQVMVDQLLYKNPNAFHFIWLLIPLVGIYVLNLHQTNRLVQKSHPRVMKWIFPSVSTSRSFLYYFFFRNAFVFLVIALAQPIYGKKKVAGTAETMELVVCLDISNSMNVRDISKEASRLDIAKRALVQLVNNLHGEKIGLALFANNAFVQLPLTRDYPAAKLFIQEIESNMISSQGTNISEALNVAVGMFSKSPTTKGIIIVTDGENHEEDPTEILTKIKDSDIQLSVLGIGTEKGGLIPKNPYRPELGYKTNAVGKTVISKLNEAFLKEIAQKGGGRASVSSSEFPNLSALLTQLAQMKRTKIDTFDFDVKAEQYPYPLVVGLIFWFLALLGLRRPKTAHT